MKKGNFTGWLTQVLPEKQMSEAFINSIFLAMSGGFQDAYTYFTRDKVFSNAQTGNVVLMSQHFMMKEWSKGFHYLLPLFAFAAGVFAAEQIQSKFRYAKKLHWRQGILLFEILILFLVGFIPSSGSYNLGILCLCHAGSDFPQGQRLFLRQHHVYWQPSQWYRSPVCLFQRT